ncbi:urease accessory protein UreD [Flavobacterium psychrotolerans]|uniref:Urease accessory protein UreD n=1 Tax=Flavobacterium psychrotolerans TaxID=2169410 RepID=A0A2U1JM35_9FLAO|nr:urease accessory protein UreD [Flavobacterium psychrotolerans]PWA06226.1 urease accessory protein [Flavobacterium psychrotolerans]
MKAKLHIQTTLRNGLTQLGNCYFSPPFKVMNITEDKTAKQLHLMLMSSSPGILDEDEYEMRIDVIENGVLQLHTQSYQRLFNMVKGAKQTMEVHLQDNASFTYLPHPSVPHENSIFKAKNKIYLSTNCKLIWGEILTCGRKLKGEVFTFSKYHNSTELFLNNKLIIKENVLIQPLLMDPNSMGHLGGFTHQASLIIIHETIPINEFTDTIYEFLQQQIAIDFGVSTTPSNGIIVRILGYKAEQLYDCLKHIASLVATLKTDIHA